MGFYTDRLLPHLLHLAMRAPPIAKLRQRVVPAARGRVLELGMGSGLNLPLYGPEVERVVGVDPSERLLAMARRAAEESPLSLAFEAGSAEALPFEAGSFDTVVSTWTLCSIPDAAKALAEARRVLAPGGRLLFIEHGLAPESSVARWQDRLNPLWRRCAGGCNMNRAVDQLVRSAGFAFETLETGYLVSGPRPLTYHYTGAARPD